KVRPRCSIKCDASDGVPVPRTRAYAQRRCLKTGVRAGYRALGGRRIDFVWRFFSGKLTACSISLPSDTAEEDVPSRQAFDAERSTPDIGEQGVAIPRNKG